MSDQDPKNIAELLKATPYQLDKIRKNSGVWFETQAAKLLDVNGMDPKTALQGDAKKNRVNIQPGSMYFFMYDAKHKDKLPYYDMFPLVLPFATAKGGFLGLNLHYLPYDMRISLLWNLQQFNTAKGITPTAKLKFQWEMLQGAAKFKKAQPCVKHYLTAQVRSSFRLVPPEDWATACMLPLERFSGSDKFNVWAESIGKK